MSHVGKQSVLPGSSRTVGCLDSASSALPRWSAPGSPCSPCPSSTGWRWPDLLPTGRKQSSALEIRRRQRGRLRFHVDFDVNYKEMWLLLINPRMVNWPLQHPVSHLHTNSEKWYNWTTEERLVWFLLVLFVHKIIIKWVNSTEGRGKV